MPHIGIGEHLFTEYGKRIRDRKQGKIMMRQEAARNQGNDRLMKQKEK